MRLITHVQIPPTVVLLVIMALFDTDISKSDEELLSNIMAAVQQSHMPGLPFHPFSVLLIKISKKTGETIDDLKRHITELNHKNSTLQTWVMLLAIISLISTIIQTLIAVLTYFYPSTH